MVPRQRGQRDRGGPVGVVVCPTVALMLEAQGLTKRFGDVEALAGLDLDAPARSVLAVLGPNGAGKTTFIRTIATLLRPDAGTLHVDGIDVARGPEAGSPDDRPRGPVRRGRARADRTREPAHGRSPVRPRPSRRECRRRRRARAARTHRCRRPTGPHVFGRHAAPARPRREPRRRAASAAPRRTDHRSRPAQSQRALARDRGPGAGGHRRRAHHAVPRRSRPARRQDRDHRPRSARRLGHQQRAEVPARARCHRRQTVQRRRPRARRRRARRRSVHRRRPGARARGRSPRVRTSSSRPCRPSVPPASRSTTSPCDAPRSTTSSSRSPGAARRRPKRKRRPRPRRRRRSSADDEEAA